MKKRYTFHARKNDTQYIKKYKNIYKKRMWGIKKKGKCEKYL